MDPKTTPIDDAEPKTPADEVLSDDDVAALEPHERAAWDEIKAEGEDAAGEGGDAAVGDPNLAAAPPPVDQAQGDGPAPAAPTTPTKPDFSAERKVINTRTAEIKELSKKLDDGDITRDEFDRRFAASDAERVAALARVQAYEMKELDRWHDTVDAFMAAEGNAWLKDRTPIKAAGNRSPLEIYDAELKSVTGSKAYQDLPWDRQISLAASRARAELEALGVDLPGAAGPAGLGRRPDPPKTLKDIPSSDRNGAQSDQTAAMDRIIETSDPFDAEAAFASLPEAMQDRWLNS